MIAYSLDAFFFVEKAKDTSPLPLVVTLFWPRSFLPSSVPGGLEKNWTVKDWFGTLFRLPVTTVLVRVTFFAFERVGKFWRPLGPVSMSS